MIPDELIDRAHARATELGWDVRWVDIPGQQRKIIAIDPAEPEPFNKVELTLGDNQTWWSGAIELGLIDSVEIDDLFNVIDLQAAIDERRQVLMRLNDQSTWLGTVQELGRAKKVLSLRCEVRRVPVDDAGLVRVKGEEKVIPANVVREIVYLKTSTCPGCSEEFWFAPHEKGDACPKCGAFIENENLATAEVCADCGAIRPCKCDVWNEAVSSRAAERLAAEGRGSVDTWDCAEFGHALRVGSNRCLVCTFTEPDIKWDQIAIGRDLPVDAMRPGQKVHANGHTFTIVAGEFVVDSEGGTKQAECKSRHRFVGGSNYCADCGLHTTAVPGDWNWQGAGTTINAVAPIGV